MKVCDIYKHFGHLITKTNLFLIESVAIANNGIFIREVTSQTVLSSYSQLRTVECNPAQKVKQLFRTLFFTPFILGNGRVPGVAGQRADDKELDRCQTREHYSFSLNQLILHSFQ